MELKESYVRKYDNGEERVTHIQCTNCDGQTLIKLVEKWTDIFSQWAPVVYMDYDEETGTFVEVGEEKEKLWDKFSLEIIDEADMPAPFDKYFHPWEKKRIHLTSNEAYGERVCFRGRSETGATVCICFRSSKWYGKWDRFVLYKPSGKEKTMLTYIVTDEHSPKKLTEYDTDRYQWGQFDMNFYLDFDKGDGNYITVEGTSGRFAPRYDKYRDLPCPTAMSPSWASYAERLQDSKDEDAGYSDFHSMDLSLFSKLDEASEHFFKMLKEHKNSLGALGLNKEKARQEKMKHASEEERAAMEKQSSLLDSLDSI